MQIIGKLIATARLVKIFANVNISDNIWRCGDKNRFTLKVCRAKENNRSPFRGKSILTQVDVIQFANQICCGNYRMVPKEETVDC